MQRGDAAPGRFPEMKPDLITHEGVAVKVILKRFVWRENGRWGGKSFRSETEAVGSGTALECGDMPLARRKTSVPHGEAIVRRLRKDPEFAAEYLRAPLEDEDESRVLLLALRHLAQAQGIAKVAKAAGIERESLYKALSARGNPRVSALVAVSKAIGLRLTVEAAQ